MRTVDLRQREVINIVTAERMGFVADVELNSENGVIEALIVPKRNGLFAKHQEYLIPWEKIVSVGKDIVLVDMPDGGVVR